MENSGPATIIRVSFEFWRNSRIGIKQLYRSLTKRLVDLRTKYRLARFTNGHKGRKLKRRARKRGRKVQLVGLKVKPASVNSILPAGWTRRDFSAKRGFTATRIRAKTYIIIQSNNNTIDSPLELEKESIRWMERVCVYIQGRPGSEGFGK